MKICHRKDHHPNSLICMYKLLAWCAAKINANNDLIHALKWKACA